MSTPVEAIFNLLLEGSSGKALFAGGELSQALGLWAVQASNVLVRVSPTPLPGAGGWIVVEAGQPTYAWAGRRSPGEALAFLSGEAARGWCQAAFLLPAERLLALAVCRGQPLAVRQPVTPEDRTLRSTLEARRFEGVLLLEQGANLSIWSDRGDGWLAPPLWPADLGGGRKSLFRWPASEAAADPDAPLPQERRNADFLWRALERELGAELDERAPRLLALLRREHGQEDPSTLLYHVMPHLERVSGRDSAHRFRQRFLQEWLGEL